MNVTDTVKVKDGKIPSSRLLLSPAAFFAIALPVVLWLTLAVYFGGMSLQDALTTRTLRVFVSLFILLLSVKVLVSLVQRSFAVASVSGGIILLLAQVVVWYGFRFSGEAGAGTGDQIVDYHREQKGVWCGDTRIPARVEAISGTKDAPIEFSIGEKRLKVPLQGSFDWKGYRVSPIKVEWAPLMSLETAAGENVETLYIKMGTVPPERDFFLVKTLPHRIYIAPDSDKGIKLRIIRDKIEVASTSVVWGEKLPYDGHYISFSHGEPWARLTVEKKITTLPAFAGGGMLVAGLMSTLLRKRREKC